MADGMKLDSSRAFPALAPADSDFDSPGLSEIKIPLPALPAVFGGTRGQLAAVEQASDLAAAARSGLVPAGRGRVPPSGPSALGASHGAAVAIDESTQPSAPERRCGIYASPADRAKRTPPSPKADGRYTTNPSEVVARRTQISARDFVTLVRAHWPALSDKGARMLAAHWFYETRQGYDCYNYNFTNIKQPDLAKPHMFLATAEQTLSVADATKKVDASPNLACITSGGTPSAPRVLFYPPHREASFHPYATADEGMAALVKFDKDNLDARHPGYVDALNRGDVATMVHILGKAHFYTEIESVYRHGVAASLHWVDAQLAKGTP